MIARALLVVSVALLALATGCDYARMNDDDAFDTYRTEFPPMPKGTVPLGGGIAVQKSVEADALVNPLPADRAVVERGRQAYGHYCVHCHGPLLDGNGIVGQSFAPLPTDLRSPVVQGQRDGSLFRKISFGYGRHPPLAETVEEGDRWAVLRYLRAFGTREGARR